MRYKLTIEYEGTNYYGWQKQNNKTTIQGNIEKALYLMFNENIEIFGSGRTDAGVHALNQIAHFDYKEYPEYKIVSGLNNYLKELSKDRIQDIVIKKCEIVDNNFESRFGAKIRHYKYLIFNSKVPTAILKNRVWQVRKELNIDYMNLASKILIGEHDFSSFRCSECQALSPVKIIYDCKIFKNYIGLIEFNISANSFLQHMVRNIVGTLKDVGIGKISIDEFEKILKSKDRNRAGATAPAYGLYLDFVEY